MRCLIAVLLMAQPVAETPVYLNHFYLTVDNATYAMITGSDFLRTRFAPFEERRTVRTDSTYTGAYFYGRNTYFEFFNSATERRAVGDSALAFGVEQPGALDALASTMAGAGEVSRDLRTRELDGRQVPWFSQLAFGSFGSDTAHIRSFIMEYDPAFLRDWHAGASPSDGTIERANILRRYVAVLPQKPKAPLLVDVTAVTLAAERWEADQLARQLRLFGYTAAADDTVFKGPDLTLYLVAASPSRHGIQRVSFRTAGTPERPLEYSFGPRSKLTFTTDHTAEWTF